MAKKIKIKILSVVKVIDPDSGNEVDVTLFKMETGGIIGIDSSFLENTDEPVYSPFDKNRELDLED
jgi:hypothetical protein